MFSWSWYCFPVPLFIPGSASPLGLPCALGAQSSCPGSEANLQNTAFFSSIVFGFSIFLWFRVIIIYYLLFPRDFLSFSLLLLFSRYYKSKSQRDWDSILPSSNLLCLFLTVYTIYVPVFMGVWVFYIRFQVYLHQIFYYIALQYHLPFVITFNVVESPLIVPFHSSHRLFVSYYEVC